jgi:3-oxoacyl-[acyl-carrier protein] reductase
MAQAGAVIVTGASRGIGSEIAKRLARDGYPTLINYASERPAAEALAAEINAQGGRALAIAGDVSQAQTAKALFQRAKKEFDQVHAIVNNAGVGLYKWTDLGDADDDTYDHIFDVNTRGTFYMCREAVHSLNQNGRIVNVTSSLVHAPLPGLSLYTASKAAVDAFTRALAKELGGKRITVNSVAPGATATEVFLQGKTDEVIQSFADKSPLQRLGTPQDIANVVAFLVSPEGQWVNGQVIRANGGIA